MSFGCSKSQADVDSSINTFIQDLMVRRTPQQRAIEALQTENADERRKLLTKIIKSKSATAEWAVKVFASVAKTDPDAQVRCVAVKGLRCSADERVIEPLLMILNHKEHPGKVVPPAAEVRWDSTEVVKYMSDYNEIPPDHLDRARQTLIRLVKNDPDRNVRICAAQGLGNYATQDVLAALVQALEFDDFGIRHAAEDSLERLTGRRHDYDPDAWQEWLAKHPNPFVPSDEQQVDSDEIGADEPQSRSPDPPAPVETRVTSWQGQREVSVGRVSPAFCLRNIKAAGKTRPTYL